MNTYDQQSVYNLAQLLQQTPNSAVKLAQPQGKSAMHQYLMGLASDAVLKSGTNPDGSPKGTATDGNSSYAPGTSEAIQAQNDAIYGGYGTAVPGGNSAMNLATKKDKASY